MKESILLCHWNGRFGNRIHQYVYGATYADKFKIDFILPSEWEGTRLFKNQKHSVLGDDELRLVLNQTSVDFDSLKARSEAMNKYNKRMDTDFTYLNPDDPKETYCGKKAVYIDSVCAYHPEIFYKMSKKFVKEIFTFNDHVKSLDFYKYWEDKQGTYDMAHLRRDDISNAEYNKNNVQGYSVVSMNSYKKAFKKFGYDPKEVVWTSDDYDKQWHEDREENKRGGWRYPEGSEYMGTDLIFDWLPDFIKLYFARTIFRANSSFSYWAAELSPVAKTYSPVLDKQVIYGKDDKFEEIKVNFVEGNQPHWMYERMDILYEEDEKPGP